MPSWQRKGSGLSGHQPLVDASSAEPPAIAKLPSGDFPGRGFQSNSDGMKAQDLANLLRSENLLLVLNAKMRIVSQMVVGSWGYCRAIRCSGGGGFTGAVFA